MTTCTLTHQSPDTPHVAARAHTRAHTPRPRTHVPAPPTPCTCPACTWAPTPVLRGEDPPPPPKIAVATSLPILRLVRKGQELLNLGLIPRAGRVGARDCVISVVGGGGPLATACLGSGTIASRSPAAGGQMSTQQRLRMPTKSHCPLNQALFCPWNVLVIPLSLPIEIFPFPQCLARAPPPLKRPAGNDLAHFNS